MAINRRQLILLTGGALGSCLGLSVLPASAEDEDEPLAVIVAPDSELSGLSFHELKRLFMGERLKDPSGKWLVPLNRQKKSAERIGFDDSVLGMSPEGASTYWIERRIRGKSGAPKSISNEALLVRLVAKVPGAIGYVRMPAAQGVKVLKIDGKLPKEAGYGITY